MKHKAPCSSRGYIGLRESGPLYIEGEGDGDVGEDGGGVGEDRGDDGGGHETGGRAHTPCAHLALSWATRKAVDALLLLQQS